MNEQYYIKTPSGRYKPVKEFTGFPAEGVWIVQRAGHSSQLIMQLPNDLVTASDLSAKAIAKFDLKEVILEALHNKGASYTLDGLAQDIAEKLLEGGENEQS